MLRFASPPGVMPARKCFRIGFGVVLASALSVAGCASRAPTYVRAPIYQPPAPVYAPARVAGYRQENQPARISIEDDGMEAQAAPPLVRKREPDDPTEPFSPNYGRFTSLKRADANGTPVYIPNDLPKDFHDKLATPSSGT